MNINHIQQLAYQLYKVFKITHINRCDLKFLIEKDSNYLIISNHVSHWDAFLIVAQFSFKEINHIIPLRTITANRFLYWNPAGPILRLLGCYPSRPKKGRLHGLKASIQYANDGSSLLFFPQGGIQGKRGRDKPHTGAAVIANQTGIKVLPVYLAKNGRRYDIVRGKPFSGKGKDIDYMMSKVWELEKYI